MRLYSWTEVLEGVKGIYSYAIFLKLWKSLAQDLEKVKNHVLPKGDSSV